jgi:hypothetical protein
MNAPHTHRTIPTPDCSATSIRIGGLIDEAAKARLIEAIASENVRPDWGGAFGHGESSCDYTIADHIDEAIADGEPLKLYEDEQPWGKLEIICADAVRRHARASTDGGRP